ncbi:hypothetical protein H257_12979 [Aphanomyces astaci]|uniref:Uncharacterized protein n=1 Tax=Aphanomyces astaci TaxID=112090 RepID=W4FYH3_APHAT|nr:hypothetical protein H257_12979 [Aphanomyces astaci]ETV71844.1 hypothetical protein H257_12979 [Aphanomyces astaci]|eukprot:XP_009838693.1 hypothetical protein H257_12979 [Aphanomyces astaci]
MPVVPENTNASLVAMIRACHCPSGGTSESRAIGSNASHSYGNKNPIAVSYVAGCEDLTVTPSTVMEASAIVVNIATPPEVRRCLAGRWMLSTCSMNVENVCTWRSTR